MALGFGDLFEVSILTPCEVNICCCDSWVPEYAI